MTKDKTVTWTLFFHNISICLLYISSKCSNRLQESEEIAVYLVDLWYYAIVDICVTIFY